MCTFNNSDQLLDCRETFKSYLLKSCDITPYDYWDADSYTGPLRDSYYHEADPQIAFKAIARLIPYPGLVRDMLNDNFDNIRVSDYLKSFWPVELGLIIFVFIPIICLLGWLIWRLSCSCWKFSLHLYSKKRFKKRLEADGNVQNDFKVKSRFRRDYQTNYERFQSALDDTDPLDHQTALYESDRRWSLPDDLDKSSSLQVAASRKRHYVLRMFTMIVMMILVAIIIRCYDYAVAPELTAVNCVLDRTLFETFYGTLYSSFDSAFSQHTDFRGLAKLEPLLSDLFVALDDLRKDVIMSDIYRTIMTSFRSTFGSALFTGYYLRDSQFIVHDTSKDTPSQIIKLNHNIVIDEIIRGPIFAFESTYAYQLRVINSLNNIPNAANIKEKLIELTQFSDSLLGLITENLSKVFVALSHVSLQIKYIKELVFERMLNLICLLITSLLPIVLLAAVLNAMYLHRGDPVKHKTQRIRKICIYIIGVLCIMLLFCSFVALVAMAFLSHGCQVLGYDLLSHDMWSSYKLINSTIPDGVTQHCLGKLADGDLLSALGAQEYINMVEAAMQGVVRQWQAFTEVGLLMWVTAEEPKIDENFINKLQEDKWLTLMISSNFQSHPSMYLTDERIIWVTDLVAVATPFDFYGNDTLSYSILTNLLHQATQASIDPKKFASFTNSTQRLPWISTFKGTLYPLTALTHALRDIVRPTCPSFAEVLCAEPDKMCSGDIWVGASTMPVIDKYEEMIDSEWALQKHWAAMAQNAGLYSKDIYEVANCMSLADIRSRVSFLNALNWIYLKSLIYSGAPLERAIQSYTDEGDNNHDPCLIGTKCHLFALTNFAARELTSTYKDHDHDLDTSVARSSNKTRILSTSRVLRPEANPIQQVPLSVYKREVIGNIVQALRKSNHELGRYTLDSVLWLNSATRLWNTLTNTPSIFNCSIARELLQRSHGSVCLGTANVMSELALLWTIYGLIGLLTMSAMLLLIHHGRYAPKRYLADLVP